MYGPFGRALAAISWIVMLIIAAQTGGLLSFLPMKVSAILLALAATLTAFSERVQGGASSPQVRAAAAADTKGKLN